MAREAVDVIFGWQFTSAQNKYAKDSMTRPTVLVELPTPPNKKYLDQLKSKGWPFPLRTILRERLGTTRYPARIAVLGFSESCNGIGVLLKSKDAGLIDTIIAADGVATSFLGKWNEERTNLELTGPSGWMAFGELAARPDMSAAMKLPGQRHCVITHSAIPDYTVIADDGKTYYIASTARTAAAILESIYKGPPTPCAAPPGLINVDEQPPFIVSGTTYSHSPETYCAGTAGLYVIGYSNLSADGRADHIYQSQRVMYRAIRRILVDQWNAKDATAGVFVGPGPTGEMLAPGGVEPDVVVGPEAFDSGTDYSVPWQDYVPKAKGPGSGTVVSPPSPGGVGIPSVGTEPAGPGFVATVGALGVGAVAGWAGYKAYKKLARKR